MRVTHRMFAFVSLLALCLLPCTLALASDTSMHLISPGKGWAIGSNQRLFWTNDNGAHWSDITPKAAGFMTDIFFLDESRGWVLLTSEDEEKNLVSFVLAGTSDSGRAWTFLPMVVPGQEPDELDGRAWLDFVDPQHGWVVILPKTSSAFSWALLMATEDGGKTWKELPQVPVRGRPVFVSTTEGWIIGNGGEGVYSTQDGGKSWQGRGPSLEDLPRSPSTRAFCGEIKFTDPKHGFLPITLSPWNTEKGKVATLVLFVTDDGGQTWKHDRMLTDSHIGSFDPSSIATIATASGIESTVLAFRSDHMHPNRFTLITIGRAGEAAATVTSTLPLREHDYVLGFSFAGRADGWAYTSLGTLLSTTDGGATWKDISPIAVVRSVAVSPSIELWLWFS